MRQVADGQPHLYVRWVIDSYLRLPDTPTRARPQDHQLAAQLHQRGVPETIIETAFLLATARRSHRPTDAAPLSPIRSLHYFLPVIEELLNHPPPPAYLQYLRDAMTMMIDRDPVESGPKKDAFT